MLRRLVIAFFVLANLISQVSVAYACGMMGGAPVVAKHCCCPGEMTGATRGEPAANKDCCHKVVEVLPGPADQLGALSAPIKLPAYDAQPLPPALLPALVAILIPVRSLDAGWVEADDSGPLGTDLYLRTQRLRL